MTEKDAKLILDIRISRFDHAGDVNEALEIAKHALEEIQKYREIGTVEEFQAATDRATAKPLTNLGTCPNCGRYIGADVRPWCHSCGQRLDWEAKR